MSTLSKLFVVMVLVLALVLLGVNATLFAMRADFKHKWVEETRHHFQTQMVNSAQMSEMTTRIGLLTDANNQLRNEKDQLQTDLTSVNGRLSTTEKELQTRNTDVERLNTNLSTLTRAVETQGQQV